MTDSRVEAVASILRRIERPRRYAGDWEKDTARRILAALTEVDTRLSMREMSAVARAVEKIRTMIYNAYDPDWPMKGSGPSTDNVVLSIPLDEAEALIKWIGANDG